MINNTVIGLKSISGAAIWYKFDLKSVACINNLVIATFVVAI